MLEMPEGIRNNGISEKEKNERNYSKNEEEEEENKKSNLNLSDLLRTGAMATEKNGNCGGRLRLASGPRDSDYVILVLNQRQREEEEVNMLIHRLQDNGVTCLFMKNGVAPVKPPETPEEQSTIPIPNQNVVQPEKLLESVQMNGCSPMTLRLSFQTTKNYLESSSVDEIEEEEVAEDSSSNVIKKKRKRRRKYPYLARKPIIPVKRRRKVVKEVEEERGKVSQDPYVFIPDDSQDKVEPLKLFSPNKSKVMKNEDLNVIEVNEDNNTLTVDTEKSEKEDEEPKRKRKQRKNEVCQLLTWAIAPRPSTPRSTGVMSFPLLNSANEVEAALVKDLSPVAIDEVKQESDVIDNDLKDEEKIEIVEESKEEEDPPTPSSPPPPRKKKTFFKVSFKKHKNRKRKKRSELHTKPKKCKVQIVNNNCVQSISTEVNEEEEEESDTEENKVNVDKIIEMLDSEDNIDKSLDNSALDLSMKSEEETLPIVTPKVIDPPQEEVIFAIPHPPPPLPQQQQEEINQMKLRRPSFYSLISGNVRNNLENFLDGRATQAVTQKKRRKRIKNGFLLHHGDNFPEDPEAPYKLHLATQIILKLNKRRSKFKPKEEKSKSLLSYLKLLPKRASRNKNVEKEEIVHEIETQEKNSVFSGEWVQERNFVCNICGVVEKCFWDMVHHKGEVHPGVVVTHVELVDLPPVGFRGPPPIPPSSSLKTPPCTKCGAVFETTSLLHLHIFECAGNTEWLQELKVEEPQEQRRKKKGRRKRGFNAFKRRLSNTPKPISTVSSPPKRKQESFKCEFCTREFKTEGWLKNHLTTHSLPISIPLDKLKMTPGKRFFGGGRRGGVVRDFF